MVKVEFLFLFLLGIVLMNRIYLGLLIIFIVTILSSFLSLLHLTPFSFLILFVHAESLKNNLLNVYFIHFFSENQLE